MLELPEVEVLRKDLEKEIVGKKVKTVTVHTASIVRPYHRTRPELVKALEGRKIESVRRRGKVLFVDLDDVGDGAGTWVVDPGEEGTLHRETAAAPPGEFAQLVVTFTTGGAIHLSDEGDSPTASTGVVPTAEAMEIVGISPTAMDPLDDNPTWMDFGGMLQAFARPLRAIMTDDNLMLGLGTVYTDEILWEAGLRYDRMSDTLSMAEVRRYYRAMQEVIAAAMKARGSSLDESSPESATDEDGVAAEHIKVYGRQGLPCLRCRSLIAKHRIKTRTYTYYCEQCQI